VAVIVVVTIFSTFKFQGDGKGERKGGCILLPVGARRTRESDISSIWIL
jgi:hypothetical protein